MVKNQPASAGDTEVWGSFPGLGRSPGGGNGYLVQYSCLENPMDRRAWRAAIHEVAESDTTERAHTLALESEEGKCFDGKISLDLLLGIPS